MTVSAPSPCLFVGGVGIVPTRWRYALSVTSHHADREEMGRRWEVEEGGHYHGMGGIAFVMYEV